MWNTIVVVLAILLCGWLWRIGGSGQTWARRVSVPTVIALVKFYLVGYWTQSMNWLVLLYMPALWGSMSLFSYGRSAPPHKFWSWALGIPNDEENQTVEIVTRGTCGFFWAFAAGAFVVVTGNLVANIWYAAFLMVANGYVGGTIKNAVISERIIGACVACALLV